MHQYGKAINSDDMLTFKGRQVGLLANLFRLSGFDRSGGCPDLRLTAGQGAEAGAGAVGGHQNTDGTLFGLGQQNLLVLGARGPATDRPITLLCQIAAYQHGCQCGADGVGAVNFQLMGVGAGAETGACKQCQPVAGGLPCEIRHRVENLFRSDGCDAGRMLQKYDIYVSGKIRWRERFNTFVRKC